jgi:hypothetical protein
MPYKDTGASLLHSHRRAASFGGVVRRGSRDSLPGGLAAVKKSSYPLSSRLLATLTSPGVIVFGIISLVFGIGYTLRAPNLDGLISLGKPQAEDSSVAGAQPPYGSADVAISSFHPGPALIGYETKATGEYRERGDLTSYLEIVADRKIPMIAHIVYDPEQEGAGPAIGRVKEMNPAWEVRTYMIGMLDTYVQKWYGSDVVGWNSEDGDIQQGRYNESKSNLFRYLVVAKFGGVSYQPSGVTGSVEVDFSELIHPADKFVTVWNKPYSSAKEAIGACHTRQRSLRHDVFGATANHPILLDLHTRIKSMGFQDNQPFSENEITGEGVFTDAVVSYALRVHSNSQVRLLPTVALRSGHSNFITEKSSCRFSKYDDRDLELLERVVQREAKHFLVPLSVSVSPAYQRAPGADITGFKHALNPEQNFDVVVNNDDFSSSLMLYGAQYPLLEPSGKSMLTDVILGVMPSYQGALVDVGPGFGLEALAAASAGHRVIAFEIRPRYLEAFKQSLERNGLDSLVTVHEVPLGARSQDGDAVCLKGLLVSDILEGTEYTISLNQSNMLSTGKDDASMNSHCLVKSKRRAGHLMVGDERIAILKISASGWSGHILDGFWPLIQPDEIYRPRLIVIEWNAQEYEVAGYEKPLRLVEALVSLGYSKISHRGLACDGKSSPPKNSMKRNGESGFEQLGPSTLCNLSIEDFRELVSLAEEATFETILFELASQ